MKVNRIWTFAGYVFAALLLMAAPAFAQISSSTGAIQGTVSDQTGAVISGAKVVVVNTATGVRSEVATQSDGTYVLSLLSPGSYRIEIEAEGFRRTVLSQVAVEVTKVTVANAKMELGAVASEVVVTDAVQRVDTATATTGDVINAELVRSIPLPTRNFLDLTALQAGVAATMSNPAALGRGAPQLFVAGQRGTVNNFVLNGVDANNFGNNNFGNVPIPNPDAIREFRVSTSQYDASQGRGSGGNIAVVQVSGTNQYHGSAFWFYRSDALNANDFFFNRTGTEKPVLLQNQFGGSIGGPVPGMNETFWFFNYQGMRQKNGVAGSVQGSQPVLSATRDAATLAADFGVPVANIDPVAVAWLNQPGPYNGMLYPSGTCQGLDPTVCTGPGSIGQLNFSSPSIFNEDQYSATFDRDLFTNNRIGVRFFFANVAQTNPVGGGVTLGQGQDNPQTNTHVAISDSHTFSSTLFNEFRAGYTLIKNSTEATEGTTLQDIGMSRFNSAFFDGTPAVFMTGLLSWGGISTNNDQASQALTYTIGDTLSWVRGKHAIRGGMEFRRYHVNLFNHFASRGFLNFPNFASFLTGTPNDVFVGTGITDRGFRAWDMAGFVQDDYRIFRRLTLNLGLRYDIMMPSVDIRDRIGNFDPNLITPACIAAGGGACLQDGFIAPAGLGSGFGTPGVSKSTLLDTDLNNFAPRIGLAWDVRGDGKLAVRSGYGVYFIRTSNQTLLQLITGAPFFQLFRVSGTGVIGSQALANPYPVLPTPDQFPVLPTFPQFTGFSAAGSPLFNSPLLTLNPFERTLVTPYNQNWNLTVQYEFLKNWTVEAGYIGSRAAKMLHSRQINSARLVSATDPGLGGLTVNSSLNANARTLVPGFSTTGLNAVMGSGQSWYNAFILSVRRPFVHGLQFKADYTFSKSLDNNSGAATQDLGNAGGNQLAYDLNKGLSIFDQTHRMVFTYLWDIPGPKQGWMRQALGGWRLSGVTTFQSGFPVNIVGSATGNLQGVGPSSGRVNVSCSNGLTTNGNVSNNVDNYVTISCFSAPTALAVGTVLTGVNADLSPGSGSFLIGNLGTSTTGGILFGNSGRGLVRAPFQQRFDAAITKNFPLNRWLGESGNLEFRTEFFKLFNTPIFGAGNINANVNSATFGQITGTQDTTGRIIQFALKLSF